MILALRVRLARAWLECLIEKLVLPALKIQCQHEKGGWVWNEENLRTYLSNTKKGIKKITGDDGAKTKMAFKVKAGQMDEIISFLKGLK